MTCDWLAQRASLTPHRLALMVDGETLTYAELDQQTTRLAAGLLARGVQPGDRVAALMATGPLYAALVHALARLQVTLVPLNTRLTREELAWQIARVEPQLLLFDDEFAATAAAFSLPNETYVHPRDLVRTAATPHALPVFDLAAPQAILFTSGTTGQPKGVVLSFANHFWSATASSDRLGLEPQERWLSCLPLYHVGGMAVLLRSCLYGTTAVLHPRFEVDAFLYSIDTERITLTSVVPTMLQRLLAVRTTPWPAALRLVLLGGAAASEPLLSRAAAQQLPVAPTYGLTEAASQVATALPAAALSKPGTVGRPLMFTTVRVLDATGQPAPPGVIGEIAVRGPTVMQGYFDEPEATARTLVDGELRTGDLGYLDEDGDLFVVQRRTDLIVSGGENIYPAEVEAALESHPAVARACVVGLPDAEWGQTVGALVEPLPGATVELSALKSFLRERLAGYKQPRVLALTTALPQTASGKIERRRVVELLAG